MRNIRTQRFGNTERKTFSRIKEVLDLPNLIEVQKNSYDAFVREGIREVFDDFSPIVDYSGRFELQFLEHALDFKSKYSGKRVPRKGRHLCGAAQNQGQAD